MVRFKGPFEIYQASPSSPQTRGPKLNNEGGVGEYFDLAKKGLADGTYKSIGQAAYQIARKADAKDEGCFEGMRRKLRRRLKRCK